MKRAIILSMLAVGLIAVPIVWAHEKVKLTGYVVDVACGADHAKDTPEDATKFAAEHIKECGLMEECVKSGYGIFADGKWYPFDSPRLPHPSITRHNESGVRKQTPDCLFTNNSGSYCSLIKAGGGVFTSHHHPVRRLFK